MHDLFLFCLFGVLAADADSDSESKFDDRKSPQNNFLTSEFQLVDHLFSSRVTVTEKLSPSASAAPLSTHTHTRRRHERSENTEGVLV